MTAGTEPSRAAYEAFMRSLTGRCPDVPVVLWERLDDLARDGDASGDTQADWDAAAQAAIEAAAEHPACDAHRWYAVVKHCGAFAYGFAATRDGLRVWDDASEFEYAKARDFE